MGRITERTHVISAMEAAADGYDNTDLLGECPHNARRLYDEIQERDVTAHIIRGGLDLPRKDNRPSSMEEAEDLGVVHWWVEALAAGKWYTVDLAAEDSDHYDEQLLTPRRPATYIPFEIDPPESEMFATR
jgi:hypothetical protein